MARYEEIDIDQGADVAIELHLINDDGSVKNLSGHDCAAKLKRSYNSDSSDTTDGEYNTVIKFGGWDV